MQTPYTSNLVVITGGPGSGKTTLINHLNDAGFETIPEIAQTIIDQQLERGGNALPWADTGAYCGLLARGAIRAWQQGMAQDPRPVFMDHALPDSLALRQAARLPDEPALKRAIDTYRYRRTVFMLPPWAEIYKIGQNRSQSFADTVRNYVVLCRVYLQCGYDIVEIRKGPVDRRAAQILGHLKL